MRRSRGPWRNGKVHVLATLCQTCIFRPGNLMHLKPGRVEQMVEQARRSESCIPCHATLSGEHSVCRGFFERHATAPLQIAERLGMLQFVTPPNEHT